MFLSFDSDAISEWSNPRLVMSEVITRPSSLRSSNVALLLKLSLIHVAKLTFVFFCAGDTNCLGKGKGHPVSRQKWHERGLEL